MFKLKVDASEHKMIKKELNLVESKNYNYVLTTDKDLVEEDKINIVFRRNETTKVARLLDLVVHGEDLFVVGTNEFGLKKVESRNFTYFIVEDDIVFGVLHNTRLIIRMKLYEIDSLNYKIIPQPKCGQLFYDEDKIPVGNQFVMEGTLDGVLQAFEDQGYEVMK